MMMAGRENTSYWSIELVTSKIDVAVFAAYPPIER
jgi:hypothetical protein